MFLQKLLSQMGLVFGGLSPTKRIMLMLTTLLSAGVLISVIMWICSPDYQTLYTGINSEDAGSIITYLKENRIQYKISAGGNNILVPGENVYELRMELASRGLPQGTGIGFEIFDNSNIGMSEFAQNINYQRALQGEIARTINQFYEIESSRVHIVMPSKSIFRDYEEPSTASVIVKLKGGRKLSKNKVQSIVHLLSSSVSGLDPDHVTVVDNNGDMLTNGQSQSGFDGFSQDQLEYQEKIEKSYQNRIKSMLETALGPANAVVRVSCLLNFKKQEKTEELYYPENRVIRSEQHYNEMSSNREKSASGVPSATTSEEAENDTADPSAEGYRKKDQTINYEIGKVTSHTIEPVGEIKRLSVAVVVDGTYRETVDEEGNTNVEYVARTPEEMDKLKNITMRAINFDAQRGDEVEIVNIPFDTSKSDGMETEESPGFGSSLLSKYSQYIKYGAAGFILLMTFLFVVRPIVTWITASTLNEQPLIDQLPKRVSELEGKSTGPAKQISYQDQASRVLKDDQSSLELLREWMSEA
jgi:flagellar M-ring protein FliF